MLDFWWESESDVIIETRSLRSFLHLPSSIFSFYHFSRNISCPSAPWQGGELLEQKIDGNIGKFFMPEHEKLPSQAKNSVGWMWVRWGKYREIWEIASFSHISLKNLSRSMRLMSPRSWDVWRRNWYPRLARSVLLWGRKSPLRARCIILRIVF